MLILSSTFKGRLLFSLQASHEIGSIDRPIIDPDKLEIIAFFINSPLLEADTNVLMTRDIRETSPRGPIIDGVSDLVNPNDIIKIKNILALNFDLVGLKVVTESGKKLGRVIDFVFENKTFLVEQLIVQGGKLSALFSPELTISRTQITKIDDYQITVKDATQKIKERKEDPITEALDFVNPFKKDPALEPSDSKTK